MGAFASAEGGALSAGRSVGGRLRRLLFAFAVVEGRQELYCACIVGGAVFRRVRSLGLCTAPYHGNGRCVSFACAPARMDARALVSYAHDVKRDRVTLPAFFLRRVKDRACGVYATLHCTLRWRAEGSAARSRRRSSDRK